MRRIALLFLACSILILLLFEPLALAKRPLDSDGRIPLVYGCDLAHDWGGRTHTVWDKTTVKTWVELNWCRLTMQGAGPYDLYRILKHERAHAVEGWEHYEGTPEKNAAYFPDAILITGHQGRL